MQGVMKPFDLHQEEMDLEQSRFTVSHSKLIRIVISFELLVPTTCLIVSAVAFLFYPKLSLYDQDEPSEEYHALKHAKEILTLTCYYSYMVMKLGLTILLWQGKFKRNLSKLNIWVVVSIILQVCAVCLAFVAWMENISHLGLIEFVVISQIIVSTFCIIVIIHFIHKYRSHQIFNYDECISLRFEPKASTVQLNVTSA